MLPNNYSIQQVDALGLVSCLTAVKHIINNMDNSPSTKERYQLMTKKGCNIEVKCAKCCPKGLGGSRTSAEGDPKSSIIEICPRFLKSQEYYSKIFLHEFSHAFDYCVNTDDIYWAWKCSVNIRHSICTELRAYFNDPPKDWYPGKKEDVIKKACDSVKLPCISWNDPDGEKARKRCLDLAPEIYDVCTQLDPTDPLPPIPPDWNIPIGLFP